MEDFFWWLEGLIIVTNPSLSLTDFGIDFITLTHAHHELLLINCLDFFGNFVPILRNLIYIIV